MSKYITTIGLEVHCELKTQTKLFCSCENSFGKEPNTLCCPVCCGFPGTMPVLNEQAVLLTVKAGLALGCKINEFSKWDRKNFFYPDLPKAWQTSQFDLPLCYDGELVYTINGVEKKVRIERIHLEEDAGKLVHGSEKTCIDYNRCGVPLIEIVTKPDLHTPEETVAFLQELKSVLKSAGVSDVKMQEGSMRCDVNLSVAKEGESLGVRTESKNLNSFHSVLDACKYEEERQIQLLESGQKVRRETRRWSESENKGYAMREKENASDYRYFAEPDLLPVVITPEQISKIASTLPPTKKERITAYKQKFGLSEEVSYRLTADQDLADLFDETVLLYLDAKRLANFILSDITRLAKEQGKEELSIKIKPWQIAEALALVSSGKVNITAVQQRILPLVWDSDNSPNLVAKEYDLIQSLSKEDVESIVKTVIAKNPNAHADYKQGKKGAFTFFVGQVMKESKGKANPSVVNDLLNELL